jgi:alpha-D-ribose 1-methylphosphonate 5-triphosphate diphosphatase PhnM
LKISVIQYRLETIICTRAAKAIKMGGMKVAMGSASGSHGERFSGEVAAPPRPEYSGKPQ